MMNLRDEVRQRALQYLYPLRAADGEHVAVEYHRLAILFALCTRDDLLAATFPFGGGANPDALLKANIGLDQARIKAADIARLEAYREHFAGVCRAWLELSDYENPPCPDNKRLGAVIEKTREL